VGTDCDAEGVAPFCNGVQYSDTWSRNLYSCQWDKKNNKTTGEKDEIVVTTVEETEVNEEQIHRW
jgi:hypothetical protein